MCLHLMRFMANRIEARSVLRCGHLRYPWFGAGHSYGRRSACDRREAAAAHGVPEAGFAKAYLHGRFARASAVARARSGYWVATMHACAAVAPRKRGPSATAGHTDTRGVRRVGRPLALVLRGGEHSHTHSDVATNVVVGAPRRLTHQSRDTVESRCAPPESSEVCVMLLTPKSPSLGDEPVFVAAEGARERHSWRHMGEPFRRVAGDQGCPPQSGQGRPGGRHYIGVAWAPYSPPLVPDPLLGTRLVLYWHHSSTTHVPHWYYIGTDPEARLHCIGTALGQQSCTGFALILHRYCIATALVLRLDCIGFALVLHWYCARVAL